MSLTFKQTPAVLFARKDSVYKALPCDVWDEARDAMRYAGSAPVIAHPPCRLWGALSHLSTAPESERRTGFFAADAVRKWGGVLEHPAHSRLWAAAGLPIPGKTDACGGFTLAIRQRQWGHSCEKPTWLYICGIGPEEVPPIPRGMGPATHCIARSPKNKRQLPHATHAAREATPVLFAAWLLAIAWKISLTKIR